MKIRTDFVTNSSSSSFILTKKVDCREFLHRESNNILNQERAELKAKENKDSHDKWCISYIKEVIEDIEPMIDGICNSIIPIREHRVSDILEVYEWYSNDIYMRVMENTDRTEDIQDGVLKKIAGVLMIAFLDKKYGDAVYGRSNMKYNEDPLLPSWKSFDRKDFRLNETEIEFYLDDFVTDPDGFYNYDLEGLSFRNIALCNNTKISEMIREYKDMDGGEILEKVLDAEYMFFDEAETHYAIIGAVEKLPECILCCNHMG